MIDSANIDVIRKNIQDLAKAQDPNRIADVEYQVGELESVVGGVTLPEGKTLTNSAIISSDFTGTTDGNGYVAIAGSDINKIVNAIVIAPKFYTCDIWRASDTSDTASVIVKSRSGTALASQSVTLKIYSTI